MIADINLQAAQTVAVACKAASGSRIPTEAVHIDVTKDESVEGVMDLMIQAFSRLDYCVNSVGVRGSTELSFSHTHPFFRFLQPFKPYAYLPSMRFHVDWG